MLGKIMFDLGHLDREVLGCHPSGDVRRTIEYRCLEHGAGTEVQPGSERQGLSHISSNLGFEWGHSRSLHRPETSALRWAPAESRGRHPRKGG